MQAKALLTEQNQRMKAVIKLSQRDIPATKEAYRKRILKAFYLGQQTVRAEFELKGLRP